LVIAGQAIPHLPQLLASLRVSTQPIEQHISPAAHGGPPLQAPTQTPPLHASPPGQALPHLPQLFGSFCVSAQPLAQHVCVPEQAGPPSQVDSHCPDRHDWPTAHTMPQPPQLCSSPCVFVHTLEQQTSPPVQAGPSKHDAGLWQTLPMQAWPGAHASAQPPQFCGSDVVSVQTVLQQARPLAHPSPSRQEVMVQVPLAQTWPAGQATSQAPQWSGSLSVSVQPEPQQVSPGVQDGPPWQPCAVPQIPWLHDAPFGHTTPHPPQFWRSSFSFTQALPQQVKAFAQPAPP